jgi:DtxR family Mn-dependent transcriptional regulator
MTPADDSMLPGQEAYLEAIYVLTTETRRVQSARIAEYLGVSAVSVSRALTRMEKAGDIAARTPEVVLSPQGWRRAETVVRRHRLAERWLYERLGLGLVEAHREAERLEHALSERVADALWEDLGRPTRCPHGNPIPGIPNPPPVAPVVALADAGAGRYVVDRIFEQLEGLEERLGWIEQAGLVPGALVELPVAKSADATSVTRLPDGALIQVPREVADRLLVRLANPLG